jgi:ubiquinone/menaquinone biosynthesis C-methylase UbiE
MPTVRALPFADAAFARVLTVHLLHLIPDWERAVEEIWRVVRPGGAFVYVVEDRDPTRVREFYLNRAHEAGLLAPHPGARSRAVTEHLEARGIAVAARRPPEMSWTQAVPVAGTLDALRARAYSLLWAVPEDAHRELMAETERFARETFPAPDAAEEATTQLQVYAASRPA